jgi:hydrogenase maturation protease
MNRALVARIANAVLYEGYILYPYRPSVKNRQRWTFGGLYTEAYCQAQGDAAGNQTECLIHGSPATVFEAVVRFLHLTARRVGEFVPPLTEWPGGAEPPSAPWKRCESGTGCCTPGRRRRSAKSPSAS